MDDESRASSSPPCELRVGDPVLVAMRGSIVGSPRYEFAGRGKPQLVGAYIALTDGSYTEVRLVTTGMTVQIFLRDEGVTWARGDTDAADALRAVVALR